jgi:AcrR family transcriptional regulator
MKISVSSLYAAFDSKQKLFEATVDYYRRKYGGFANAAMDASASISEFSRSLLYLAVSNYTVEELPKGCYVISSSPNVSAEAEQVSVIISALRNANVNEIASYLADSHSHELARANLSAHAVSRYLCAVMQGMSQQSMDGCSQKELYEIVSIATRAIDSLLVGVQKSQYEADPTAVSSTKNRVQNSTPLSLESGTRRARNDS